MSVTALQVIRGFALELPVLRDAERQALRESIEREGIRDPLVIWKSRRVVLDGHQRLRIAQELGLQTVTVFDLEFESEEEALDWMRTNQLGRRNLTDAKFAHFIGLTYNAKEKAHGGKRLPRAHGEPLVGHPAAVAVGNQFGVSQATVRRAAEFADGVETIGEKCGPEVKAKILREETAAPLPRADVPRLARCEPETINGVVNRGESLRPPPAAEPRPAREAAAEAAEDGPDPSVELSGELGADLVAVRRTLGRDYPDPERAWKKLSLSRRLNVLLDDALWLRDWASDLIEAMEEGPA
jgi:hypothetical protein